MRARGCIGIATLSLTPSLPRELQLEVTGARDLACETCRVRHRPRLGRTAGAMCLHTFRGVVDELPGLERITLQGPGEPLLVPDLYAIVHHASARGIRVGLTTNGMLLTPARASRLVTAGLDWLHVSLDGATVESIRHGARFEIVAANVRGLVALRRGRGSRTPSISLVAAAMRRDVHELADLVRLAADWGVERVCAQDLSHSTPDTHPAGACAELVARAHETADALGVELRLPRPEERV